jgi:hypothetical protein
MRLAPQWGRGRSLFFSPYRLQRATSPVSASNDVLAAAMMLTAGFYAAVPAPARRHGPDPSPTAIAAQSDPDPLIILQDRFAKAAAFGAILASPKPGQRFVRTGTPWSLTRNDARCINNLFVTPAKAGVQGKRRNPDPWIRLRGNDEIRV